MAIIKNIVSISYAIFVVFCADEFGYVRQVAGRKGVGDFEQDWGYVTVRPGAHMFWWLYYTTANVSHYTERPLIIWLQGGPGMPSSGYGNFIELGPLDIQLNEREDTWIKNFNMLFLDNPVGVGFSYVSANAKLVKNNFEIGRDLVSFLKHFLNNHEEFQSVSLYIFGESYGGKMAVEFTHQLHKEIQNGIIRANLKGLGLGDSYVSPIDYILNYAPYALTIGFVDKHGYNAINDLAHQIQAAIDIEDYNRASELETSIIDTALETTRGFDIYNVMLRYNTTEMPILLRHQFACNEFMNTVVKEILKISKNIEWSFINEDIYNSLRADFIRPVTHTIEDLLNTTDIKVIVYNGIFDFIVNTPAIYNGYTFIGTVNWLDNLNWIGTALWQNGTQEVLEINAINEAYVKKVENLVFYTVLRAGHTVPVDNAVAMKEILKRELLLVS